MSRLDPPDDEIRNVEPYSYEQAKRAVARASRDQAEAAKERGDLAERYARAEQTYRVALAKRMVELRAEGYPVTISQDLAKGDPNVAQLRYERDVADGMREAAEQRAWQASANRRSLEQLIAWSQRLRDQAEEPKIRSAT